MNKEYHPELEIVIIKKKDRLQELIEIFNRLNIKIDHIIDKNRVKK